MDTVWQSVFETGFPPIYFQEQANRTLFYTPGLLAVVPPRLVDDFHASLSAASPSTRMPQAAYLVQRAYETQNIWQKMKIGPFNPICLTLYLHNACNLACTYCFSMPYRGDDARLSLEAIRLAAEVVADNCRAQNCPLTVVFHGGGEPTLNFDLLFQALDLVEKIAHSNNLRIFRYIATNGVMVRSHAVALANRFDLIGLSCDGPDDIQNRQRPLRRAGNITSAHLVEQTAQTIHAANKALHVRVTITPENLNRQTEIADYVCRKLRPQEIHVEAVYTRDDTQRGETFSPNQAVAYLNAFLQAREIARSYGILWTTSGSRLGEIHSAYCHIWRDVLNLTPEGLATACFKLSEAAFVRRRSLAIGGWDNQAGIFLLDEEQIQYLRQTLGKENESCATCFNHYHCARNCPDACLLESNSQASKFRCQFQSLLANALIQEIAEKLAENQNLNRILFGVVPGPGL